jgi:quinol monooxygenase YgiN
MYMRLVQFDVIEGATDPLRYFYETRVLPEFEAARGCRYAALAQSIHNPSQCLSLTIWESAETEQAYDRQGTFQVLMEEMRPYRLDSSDFTIQLSENLTLEYVPIPSEPVVKAFPVAGQSDAADELSAPWLRIASLKILPGKMDEFKKIYIERAIPALRSVKGCRYVYLLESDDRRNELLSVTRWDSKEDAEAYEQSGRFQQLLETQKHLLSGLYQWKQSLGREQAGHSATSEDVMVEQYAVLTGRSFAGTKASSRQ